MILLSSPDGHSPTAARLTLHLHSALNSSFKPLPQGGPGHRPYRRCTTFSPRSLPLPAALASSCNNPTHHQPKVPSRSPVLHHSSVSSPIHPAAARTSPLPASTTHPASPSAPLPPPPCLGLSTSTANPHTNHQRPCSPTASLLIGDWPQSFPSVSTMVPATTRAQQPPKPSPPPAASPSTNIGILSSNLSADSPVRWSSTHHLAAVRSSSTTSRCSRRGATTGPSAGLSHSGSSSPSCGCASSTTTHSTSSSSAIPGTSTCRHARRVAREASHYVFNPLISLHDTLVGDRGVGSGRDCCRHASSSVVDHRALRAPPTSSSPTPTRTPTSSGQASASCPGARRVLPGRR